mgnify:CR=1 FL=1
MNKKYSEFNSLIKSLLDPKFTANYEHVDTWTSMQTLIVVSAIDEHYDVVIAYEELKACSTVKELYELVVSKVD